MASSLYHSSGLWYEPGDTILAGSWGRVILGAGPSHNRFYPEQVIELIRRNEFDDKPSRIRAAFAFEDLGHARSGWRGNQEHVYAVDLADSEAPLHRGDMAWIDAMPSQHTFEDIEACVRSYWAGKPHDDQRWEVASASDLIVVEKVT